MNQAEFEPLREMETFTEDMFNRIIAFQEKEHPAWDTSASFSARIENLPLHYLIFSNPDRDPNKHGPTVAPYYPLREEMQKLAHYIRQVQAAKVGDLYCGNGFMGSLLAREGVPVHGLRHYTRKPNQIREFFDADCYTFTDAQLTAGECDAVFASWIPAGENPTPQIVQANPKLIVYVYTDHVNQETGERQTGSVDMFDELGSNYTLVEKWRLTRPENLLHEIWPDLTPNIEETRITRVYARHDHKHIIPPESLPHAQPYSWEKELQMALLALKAKQEIRARGFTV